MDWFRHYHGLCNDPKLHKASRIAKVRRSVAIAAWCAVLEAASQADQRGAINGYDESDLAYMIDESKAVAGRILAAFAALGMVENGQVSAWTKRQFASDDVTVRVRKNRGKSADFAGIPAKNESAQNANPLKPNGTDPPCNVSETPQIQIQISKRKKDSSPTGEEKKESCVAGKPAPPPRGSRIPDDWTLTPDLIQIAAKQGFSHDQIERFADRFANHWRATAGANGRKCDWVAAWRVWVSRETDRTVIPLAGHQGNGYANGYGAPGYASRAAATAAVVHARRLRANGH